MTEQHAPQLDEGGRIIITDHEVIIEGLWFKTTPRIDVGHRRLVLKDCVSDHHPHVSNLEVAEIRGEPGTLNLIDADDMVKAMGFTCGPNSLIIGNIFGRLER